MNNPLEKLYCYLRVSSDVQMNDGGSLIGISSPGCTTIYNPQPGYDMPGSGKTIMEYVMRLMALNAGKKKCKL